MTRDGITCGNVKVEISKKKTTIVLFRVFLIVHSISEDVRIISKFSCSHVFAKKGSYYRFQNVCFFFKIEKFLFVEVIFSC